MGLVEFGELPPDNNRKYRKWKDILGELRENPGQWAKVATVKTKNNASTMVARIKNGKHGMAKPGEFEADSRGADVWARYPEQETI